MSAPLNAVQVERLTAANLRHHRRRLGVSAARLSLALSLPARRVHEVEQGLRRLPVDMLIGASAVLGVPLQRFFEDIV